MNAQHKKMWVDSQNSGQNERMFGEEFTLTQIPSFLTLYQITLQMFSRIRN